MDSAQIDKAMKRRVPVVYEGVRYERILEYVSWYNTSGARQLSAVLLAKNCTVRVPAHKVEEYHEEEKTYGTIE